MQYYNTCYVGMPLRGYKTIDKTRTICTSCSRPMKDMPASYVRRVLLFLAYVSDRVHSGLVLLFLWGFQYLHILQIFQLLQTFHCPVSFNQLPHVWDQNQNYYSKQQQKQKLGEAQKGEVGPCTPGFLWAKENLAPVWYIHTSTYNYVFLSSFL